MENLGVGSAGLAYVWIRETGPNKCLINDAPVLLPRFENARLNKKTSQFMFSKIILKIDKILIIFKYSFVYVFMIINIKF